MGNPFELIPSKPQILDQEQVKEFFGNQVQQDRRFPLTKEKELNADILEGCAPEGIESWDRPDVLTYAQAAGRLWMSQFSWQAGDWIAEHEYTQLVGHLPDALKPQALGLLKAMACIQKFEVDTNTASHWMRETEDHALLRQLIKKYEAKSLNYAVPELVNPCHIQKGTEIFRFNREKKDFDKQLVTDFEMMDDQGVLEMDGELMDLWQLNLRLGSGDSMLRDGDNCTGGCGIRGERIRKLISRFKPGARFAMTYTAPFSGKKIAYTVTVASDNRPALEEKYGQAYLPFAQVFFEADGTVQDEEGKTEQHRFTDFIDDPRLEIEPLP